MPGLFIGTLFISKKYELLKSHNITHVLSIIDDKYQTVTFKVGIFSPRMLGLDKIEFSSRSEKRR